MRGKASGFSSSKGLKRITPAYAGKSTARRRAYLFFWDHPRICGEKPLEEHGGAVITGSPPHMRGKDIRGVVQNVLFGITPAYAGKRCSDRWLQTVPGDHPRICGEKRLQSTLRGTQNGSPPHMRGKVAVGGTMKNLNGITPAYAGKRSPTGRGRFQPWDHPRICGEKPSPPARLHCFRGSPPRMRGKGFGVVRRNGRPRITPAYAGKSQFDEITIHTHWDHPRVCGEKAFILISVFGPVGSPPRMRGKEKRAGGCTHSPGITPAYAGKSASCTFLVVFLKDHPRVCGEKHVCECSVVHAIGITPAYAGKRQTQKWLEQLMRDHPRVCGEKTLS